MKMIEGEKGRLISKSDARKLIKELFSKANPTQHRFKSAFLGHSEATYKIAKETAVDIINHNPGLGINPLEVAIAGYLHDIGRLLNVNQNFHEIRGALYIKDRGYGLGIAVNKEELERLSQMIISHFIVYEEFLDEDYPGREEFSNIKASLLLPAGIEQQIIVYADLSNLEGREMDFRERLDYIENRQRNNPQFLHALERGKPRIISVCRGVEQLRNLNKPGRQPH